MKTLSRRTFLQATAAGATLAGLNGELAADQPARRPRIAILYTACYFRSHAFNFLENFLRPLLFNGKLIEAPVEVASIWADQTAEQGDMTQGIARQFKIRLAKSIEDALTLGTQNLAVDGVVLIGEHGNYPENELGQREYPRKRFFDETVAVMRSSNRFVPIFNDKHLSYRWDWAREMYDTARKLRIPLMAGSSVPLAERRPTLEIPANAVFEEAVSIHAGGFEVYDFHAFEVLQSMVETRKGNETGIRSVEYLEGDALWKAAQQGRWSRSLADAALRLEFGERIPNLQQDVEGQPVHGILVSYRDGWKATILKVGRRSSRWLFSCKIAGEQRRRATSYYVGPWGNRNLFMALAHAVQQFLVRRESPYPVERTLLATGFVEAACRSKAQRRAIATPNLEIRYEARDWRAYREMGASWQMLTEKTPETRDIRALPVRR